MTAKWNTGFKGIMMLDTDIIEQARKDFPGYVRYEITENGTLYLFSLGAYPSIVKDYAKDVEYE